MKTDVEPKEMILDVAAALDMDPDILVLAWYLARKRKITLGELLEGLITNHRLVSSNVALTMKNALS